ncbi:MAG TPA: ABC transporter permease [Pyrinomonadaceae bacterium]|nr:ABC transporter permease [Pyrinomonadaceae bacterium]
MSTTSDTPSRAQNSIVLPSNESSPNEPTSDPTPSLPDEPLVVIEPRSSWKLLDLTELWAYRELLYFLTWRDVKVRYKQTFLGVAWAVIQPLFTMAIFTLFFGRLAGLDSRTGGIPYPLFAYAGLLPWTFFSNALTSSGNSLVGNANLITKVYFPRIIVPTAAVAAGLIDFAIGFLLLVPLMIYYGVSVTGNLLMIPVLVLLITILATAVGMWLSALNVKYRDIRFALPFVIQLWMFVSPIIYPASILPPRWRWLLDLNPLTGIIEAFRSALFGQTFNWTSLAIATVLTLLSLVYAAFSFSRVERRFADIV